MSSYCSILQFLSNFTFICSFPCLFHSSNITRILPRCGTVQSVVFKHHCLIIINVFSFSFVYKHCSIISFIRFSVLVLSRIQIIWTGVDISILLLGLLVLVRFFVNSGSCSVNADIDRGRRRRFRGQLGPFAIVPSFPSVIFNNIM